jgi:class 3 adenylate cyclase
MRKITTFLLLLFFSIAGHEYSMAQSGAERNARIDSLILKLQSHTEDTDKIKILNDLAYTYRTDNPNEGIKYGIQSLSLSAKLGWKKGLARANSTLGSNYFSKSDYSAALEYWMQALKINDQLKNKEGIAAHLQNIGEVYYRQLSYPLALEYYYKALEVAKQLNNKLLISHAYTSIGNAYTEQYRFQQAYDNHLKALEIDKERNEKNDIASDLINIAYIYNEQNNFTEALKYLYEGLDTKKETGDKNGLARCYGIIGKTYLNISKTSTDKTTPLLKAIAYIDSAIVIDKITGYLDNLQKNNKSLSEAEELRNNYKEALNAYKEYTLLKDSIYSHANQTKIFSLEKKNEMELKNKQIEIARLEVARKKSEQIFYLIGLVLLLISIMFIFRSYRLQKTNNRLLGIEKKKSDDLLLNILPAEVATELKEKGLVAPKQYDNVTVLFTDFVGFTSVSEKLTPNELVHELDYCFKGFDAIIGKYNIEKIKTIGDAYLALAGLPHEDPNHATNIVAAALEMQAFMQQRKQEMGDKSFHMRAGIHSGVVVAGIVGSKKFAYDIWGDTVNTAARMEQNSLQDKVNISDATYQLVKDKYECTYRGEVAAKNKGMMRMYFVEKQKANS